MLAAAGHDALERGDVGEVAAPAEDDIALIRYTTVGGIDLQPAPTGDEDRQPGVGGIGAEEFFLTRWRQGFHITADIARSQTQRTQTTNGQVGKVLTDATLAGQHHPQWGCHCGEIRVVDKFVENALVQIQHRVEQVAPGLEAGQGIVGQRRVLIDKGRVQHKQTRLKAVTVAEADVGSSFPHRLFPGDGREKVLRRPRAGFDFAGDTDLQLVVQGFDGEIHHPVTKEIDAFTHAQRRR